MEQSPSAVNWRSRNAPKAPGQMRAWSYQSVARGADGILFFQWRQSKAGSEKFHSGMVPHGGTDTRVWREIEQLGGELARLSGPEAGVEGRRVPSSVAIALDWHSWWAIEQPASPTSVSYVETLSAWHRAHVARTLTVDFVRADGDLSAYRVVVAPAHFVATDAQVSNLAAFAESGGTLVVGFGTAITDEHLHVRLGGYLGEPLRRTLGVWIEEFAPPAAPDLRNTGVGEVPAVPLDGDVLGGAATGSTWAEFVRVDGAETLATFTEGALAGWPAVTRRSGGGGGAAWYVATVPEPEALRRLAERVIAEAGVDAPAAGGIRFAGRGGATRRRGLRDQPRRRRRDAVDRRNGGTRRRSGIRPGAALAGGGDRSDVTAGRRRRRVNPVRNAPHRRKLDVWTASTTPATRSSPVRRSPPRSSSTPRHSRRSEHPPPSRSRRARRTGRSVDRSSVGPASQLISDAEESTDDEIIDEELVAYFTREAARLRGPSGPSQSMGGRDPGWHDEF